MCYLNALISWLQALMIRRIFLFLLLISGILVLTSCQTTQNFLQNGLPSSNAEQPSLVNLQGFPNDPAFWQADTTTVWTKLQHVSLPELQKAATQSTDPNITGWLNLAIVGKQYSTSTNQLVTQLIAWRAANPSHSANALFPDNGTLTRLQNTRAPQHIVLLLPLQGQLGDSGQAVRDGFISAYYSSALKGQQTVSFVDTNQNQNISALYQQALGQGADTVIGPLTKENVADLARQGSFPVPTIALNYTDIWFGSLPTNFYEFGLSPLDEAKQVAEKARQTSHKRAIVIAPQDEWGQRVTKTLTSNWQALGGTVTDTLYFDTNMDFNQSIPRLLHVNSNADHSAPQQRRQDFDVIFLLASPQTARQIVPLLKYYYADKVPIYSTSVIYSGKPSPQNDSDLNGVTFSDMPWTLQMANKPASGGSHSNRLYAVGRDAYLLSNEILRLKTLPNFPIYGATGALTLTPKQQIYRRLAWVQMRNGRP
jgi:outer membrane PBP1 activator LpoA protein